MTLNYVAFALRRPRLDAILAILPGAYIAGGYVRDLLLNVDPRDIDILMDAPGPTPEELDNLGRLLGVSFHLHVFPDEISAEEYQREGGRTSDIVQVWKTDDATVDIIVVDDVGVHIREFPDSISQCWYGPIEGQAGYACGGVERENALACTPAFLAAHEHKFITYRGTAGTARLEKLKAKFPDYMVHIEGSPL